MRLTMAVSIHCHWTRDAEPRRPSCRGFSVWRSCHENVKQPNYRFLLAITYSTSAFAVDCNAVRDSAGEPFGKIMKPARRNISGSVKQIVGRVLASTRCLASKLAAASSRLANCGLRRIRSNRRATSDWAASHLLSS